MVAHSRTRVLFVSLLLATLALPPGGATAVIGRLLDAAAGCGEGPCCCAAAAVSSCCDAEAGRPAAAQLAPACTCGRHDRAPTASSPGTPRLCTVQVAHLADLLPYNRSLPPELPAWASASFAPEPPPPRARG